VLCGGGTPCALNCRCLSMLQKVATRPIIQGPANVPLKVLVAHSQGNSATSSLSRALHAAGNLEIAYRSAMRTEDALTILRHEAGKAYDPIMVDAVIKVAA
jgi:hypothetical protein